MVCTRTVRLMKYRKWNIVSYILLHQNYIRVLRVVQCYINYTDVKEHVVQRTASKLLQALNMTCELAYIVNQI